MPNLMPELKRLDANQDTTNHPPYMRFIASANEDVKKINEQINAFNCAKNPEEKLPILNQIYLLRQNMNNRYPLNFIAHCKDYQNVIHRDLWVNLQKQFSDLGIHSLHHRSLPTNQTQPADPSSITEVITNLPHDKLVKLIEYAWCNPTNLIQNLQTLFTKDEPGKDNFLKFLNTHQITIISGAGNSRNIKIERVPADGSLPVVLKIDARLNSPKIVENTLRDNGFMHFTQLFGEERQANIEYFGENQKKYQQTATVLLTDFCKGGDLKIKASSYKTPDNYKTLPDVRLSALNYYQQMAHILLDLQQKGCAFPDSKNTNWLIDDRNKLRIADTKSLLFTTPPDQLSLMDPKNQWSDLICSPHLFPPEMFEFAKKTRVISADKMHTYILGKNLYQYLTDSSVKFLLDHNGNVPTAPSFTPKNSFNDSDFVNPIFSSPDGQALKNLIQKMVQPHPERRIPLSEALHEIKNIREWAERQKLLAICADYTQQIQNKRLDNDVILNDYLLNIKKELQKNLDIPTLVRLRNDLIGQLNLTNKMPQMSPEAKTTLMNLPIQQRINIRNELRNEPHTEQRNERRNEVGKSLLKTNKTGEIKKQLYDLTNPQTEENNSPDAPPRVKYP